MKPPAGGAADVPPEQWQALDALWKAVLGLEAAIDALRLGMDGLRIEMEAAFKKSLTVDEKVHCLQADVSQWTKAKNRVHYALPKAREFVHRATWATAVPERKSLGEVVQAHIEPRIPHPEMDRVRERMEHLQKDRQVLFAQGNAVSQECRTILGEIQRAASTLQRNAADRARQKRSARAGKGQAPVSRRGRADPGATPGREIKRSSLPTAAARWVVRSAAEGTRPMILEVAVLDVRPGSEPAFEAAFAEARPLIASIPGYLGLELRRCVEKASRYVLLVRWRRLEDHTEGFRGSPQYAKWKLLLHHFYDPFPTVEHYRPVEGIDAEPVAAPDRGGPGHGRVRVAQRRPAGTSFGEGGAPMAEGGLAAYWIRSPLPNAPLGFGVTAWSLEDALGIIRGLDYGRFLPDDLAGVQVREGITVAELDRPHVVANMGPIAVRGMWYPFVAVGVPRWVAERRANGRT